MEKKSDAPATSTDRDTDERELSDDELGKVSGGMISPLDTVAKVVTGGGTGKEPTYGPFDPAETQVQR